MPEISILMAAYGLRTEIASAVASVFAHADGTAMEVIIASDDGTDYRDCLPADPRLVFARIGPIASSAPAARNRATPRSSPTPRIARWRSWTPAGPAGCCW